MDSYPLLKASVFLPYSYDEEDDVIRDREGEKSFDCEPAMTSESVYAVHAMNAYPKLVRFVKWVRKFPAANSLVGREIDALLREISEL